MVRTRRGNAKIGRVGQSLRWGFPAQMMPARSAPGTNGGTMGGMAAPQTVPMEVPDVDEVPELDRAWVTVVWNDPVNLMSYVTWVFQKLFGYSKEKAERLMLGVHQDGRAIVSSGPREKMEYDASRLHGYGLWATVDQP